MGSFGVGLIRGGRLVWGQAHSGAYYEGLIWSGAHSGGGALFSGAAFTFSAE